jgi:hypothetical protein
MAPVKPLDTAISPVRVRAWHDFHRLSGTNRFTLLAATLAAVGAGIGAIVPTDISAAERFGTAVVLALGAPLLTYLVAFLWCFVVAPFHQRRELIAFFVDKTRAPQPLLTMEAAIEVRQGLSMSSVRESVAFVRVYNAQERGGAAATAEHVSPEVKVYGTDKALLYHHKGWDINAWRDFTTNGEEHALWLAAKQRDQPDCYLIKRQDTTSVKSLATGIYLVEITLRGYRPEEPLRKRFVLTNAGPETDLTLEEDPRPESP